jgi:hypothetical protein
MAIERKTRKTALGRFEEGVFEDSEEHSCTLLES